MSSSAGRSDRDESAAAYPSGRAVVVDCGQKANRPRTATNGRGHDTEDGASMPDKTSPSLMPIERKPIFKYDDVLSRYWHPNGWVITQHERSWSERVGAMRGASLAGPKRWWEVRRRNHKGGHPETFLTLREAREWCDEQEGWLSRV